MTWRATKNALAGLLTGLAGGVLLGVLIVIWVAAVFSLATGPGGWAHAALYLAGSGRPGRRTAQGRVRCRAGGSRRGC
jgi:hypothetical protein